MSIPMFGMPSLTLPKRLAKRPRAPFGAPRVPASRCRLKVCFKPPALRRSKCARISRLILSSEILLSEILPMPKAVTNHALAGWVDVRIVLQQRCQPLFGSLGLRSTRTRLRPGFQCSMYDHAGDGTIVSSIRGSPRFRPPCRSSAAPIPDRVALHRDAPGRPVRWRDSRTTPLAPAMRAVRRPDPAAIP